MVTAGFVVFLAACLAPCVASELRLPLSEIAQSADLIFVGTAVESVSRRTDTGRAIVTDITFEVLEQINAGPAARQKNAAAVTITIAGGEVEGVRMGASGVPSFVMGTRYLLFILDDGNTYANPIVGGFQGVFEVIPETPTGAAYVRTLTGRAVVDIDQEGYVVSAADPFEERSGDDADAGFYWQVPSTDDPSGSAVIGEPADMAGGFPMTLDEFIDRILDSLHEVVPNPRIRLGAGYTAAGLAPYEPFDPGFVFQPEPDEIPFGSSDIEHRVPRAPSQGSTGIGSGALDTPIPPGGGTLGACGYHDLYLVMQQVPDAWWSWDINNDCMWMFNQFMHVFQYTVSDGGYGNNNGENEFCGWVSDADLYSEYGTHWGGGIAMCYSWYYPPCGEITESDIMWNSAYSWTSDEDYALGNSGVILLRPVAMHELGHSWGLQWGTYTETYDYDQPTVMHAYYHDVIENGRGLHRPDAYLIRRQYDDQTSILGTTDIGVESYWASNGLHNSTTNASTYYPGSPISFQDVTVENMSYSSVSNLRIRFYLSTNNIISTGDYLVGGYWNWASFPGESYNVGTYTTSVPTGIPAGTYYAGAIVTVNGFGSDDYTSNNSTFFYNTITILPSSLCRSPSSLDYGTTSTSKTFEVWNCSGGTISYSISDNRSWISVSPASGSSTGEHDTITVTASRSGLSPGHYTGTVTIDPNYGSNQYVTVEMDVPAPDPALCKSITSMNCSVYSGGSFTVWNCGGGTLTYAISDNRTWMTVSPTSGSSTGEYDAITVDIDRTGLVPGHYSGTVTIDPNYGSNQYVTVDMDVVPDPTAAVFRVQDDGMVCADGTFRAASFQTGAADVAEWVPVSEHVAPGDVLAVDPDSPGSYRQSQAACSQLVAGVVSTEPGVILGSGAPSLPVTHLPLPADSALLALTGIVPAKVTDEGGPIQPGDLLVTSSTPGHAMRWEGQGPCPCALVGKALEPMTGASGRILVLLTAH